MKKAWVRFYKELNDFLPRDSQKQWLSYEFISRDTVRNILITFGIPQTEVDLVLINSRPSGFDDAIHDGDQISVYPVFESFDISKTTILRPNALRKIRFILDVHLGKLTSYLRMLGFDCLYRNNLEDDEIIRIAAEEKRIILTRDKGILHNKKVSHGHYLHTDNPSEQLKEVIRHFDLYNNFTPFTRCINCNGILEKTEKQKINHKLEKKTQKYFDEFFRCNSCGQIYWKGDHYLRIKKWIDDMKSTH